MTWTLRTILEILRYKREYISVDVRQGISLFCNGETDHLKTWILEDFRKSFLVLLVGKICLYAFCDTCNNGIRCGSVSIQADQKCQVVIWIVDLVDDIKVECLSSDDSFFSSTLFKQCVLQIGNKASEDVSCAEMHPNRVFLCLLHHRFIVKMRYLDPLAFQFFKALNI